jgi:hypothetical protein
MCVIELIADPHFCAHSLTERAAACSVLSLRVFERHGCEELAATAGRMCIICDLICVYTALGRKRILHQQQPHNTTTTKNPSINSTQLKCVYIDYALEHVSMPSMSSTLLCTTHVPFIYFLTCRTLHGVSAILVQTQIDSGGAGGGGGGRVTDGKRRCRCSRAQSTSPDCIT